MKAKITLSNIKAYIQGNIRKKFFYSKYFNWLIPLHIFEQINYRIFVMNPVCYAHGECIKCGCSTPGLQMADKPCEGKCYPMMMEETDWFIYKREYGIDFNYFKGKGRNFELRVTKKKL